MIDDSSFTKPPSIPTSVLSVNLSPNPVTLLLGQTSLPLYFELHLHWTTIKLNDCHHLLHSPFSFSVLTTKPRAQPLTPTTMVIDSDLCLLLRVSPSLLLKSNPLWLKLYVHPSDSLTSPPKISMFRLSVHTLTDTSVHKPPSTLIYSSVFPIYILISYRILSWDFFWLQILWLSLFLLPEFGPDPVFKKHTTLNVEEDPSLIVRSISRTCQKTVWNYSDFWGRPFDPNGWVD